MGMNDINRLSHTKWNCKYRIVFAPKYRRQIIYGRIKQDIGQMIRKLCDTILQSYSSNINNNVIYHIWVIRMASRYQFSEEEIAASQKLKSL